MGMMKAKQVSRMSFRFIACITRWMGGGHLLREKIKSLKKTIFRKKNDNFGFRPVEPKIRPFRYRQLNLLVLGADRQCGLEILKLENKLYIHGN